MDCELSACKGQSWAHSTLAKKKSLWLPTAAKQPQNLMP